MKKKLGIMLAILFGIAACDTPSGAAVSDYNGASVKIIASSLSTHSDADALAEATRICAAGSRKTAEQASFRILPDYRVEYLFLCL